MSWISIVASLVAALIPLVIKWILNRSSNDRQKAETATQDLKDMKTYVGNEIKANSEHQKRVEAIASGVSDDDSSKLLSTYPKAREISKT